MTCLYVLAVPPREFSSANTHVQIKRVSPFSRAPFQRYVYNMRRVDCKRTTLILNFSSFLNPKVLNRGERGGVLLSKKGSWRIWICLTFGEKSFSRLGCIISKLKDFWSLVRLYRSVSTFPLVVGIYLRVHRTWKIDVISLASRHNGRFSVCNWPRPIYF